jgi:hypothetical protein
VHRPGGAEHAQWVFDYDAGDDDHETGYRFGVHSFQPSEYVSLSDNAGDTHTFGVITVSPVV